MPGVELIGSEHVTEVDVTVPVTAGLDPKKHLTEGKYEHPILISNTIDVL
jgi:hypothetical protein